MEFGVAFYCSNEVGVTLQRPRWELRSAGWGASASDYSACAMSIPPKEN
jgi:hypothetical protein